MALTKDELATMGKAFYEEDTTDERRVEILTAMREDADTVMDAYKCIMCGHHPICAPYHKPLTESHIYSNAGLKEFKITKCCEFCFDKAFAEPDEE